MSTCCFTRSKPCWKVLPSRLMPATAFNFMPTLTPAASDAPPLSTAVTVNGVVPVCTFKASGFLARMRSTSLPPSTKVSFSVGCCFAGGGSETAGAGGGGESFFGSAALTGSST
eukprot:CAMPEP_0170260746 /NCGR_PEP_ID=MMETSP0116_2-20130129/30251_1 /TAXON_ID=400756 /ORGANISM="Durinskia baltica, Strain CSIRO CS-38" /LENGTH=113 /DNA_ID=CAMNT_0010511805 /DNA_START=19 /DNA_END=357 /DNA_ORIENTATION=-